MVPLDADAATSVSTVVFVRAVARTASVFYFCDRFMFSMEMLPSHCSMQWKA